MVSYQSGVIDITDLIQGVWQIYQLLPTTSVSEM